MSRLVIEALKHKYRTEFEDAKFTFQNSDIMEDIEEALDKGRRAAAKLDDIDWLEWELKYDAEEEEPTLFDSVD